MPRGNRRGPEGAGPMTGRGFGYCAGNDQPGYTVDAVPQKAGRGLRNGAGFGRGHGRNCWKRSSKTAAGQGRGTYHTPVTDAENETEDCMSQESRDREIARLENIANTLSSELEIVKNKINELKNN